MCSLFARVTTAWCSCFKCTAGSPSELKVTIALLVLRVRTTGAALLLLLFSVLMHERVI